MPTILNPYLSFGGQAREALEFYKSVLGGELTLSTFGDFGASEDPAQKDNIMHGQLATPGGITLMAADTLEGKAPEGLAYSISLSGDDEPELRGLFDKLSAGGTVTVPFEKAPWGDTFGMATDKFGVPWMVNAAAATA